MARMVKPLSDREIKSAKAKEKDYKLFDGNGLFVLIKKNGQKYFRMNIKINSKSTTMGLGIYPVLSLAEARKMREKINEDLMNGIDPRGRKKNIIESSELSLNDVLEEWVEFMKEQWSEATYKKNKIIFEKNIYPYSGRLAIKSILKENIIEDLERIQKRNAYETANRLHGVLHRIFAYSVIKGYIEHNIIADIDRKTILKPSKTKHLPAITEPKELKTLMKNISNYRSTFASDLTVAIALEISPYLVFRPFNLRALEKNEINFEEKYIYIKSNKMKSNEDFIMPISNKVLEKIKEAINLDYRDSIYVFPSVKTPLKPISENTINNALKIMGYSGVHCPHGFRSTFSTNMHELIKKHGFNSDIIESCLAHVDKNAVRAAYNRSSPKKYLEEKRELMLWYESWIDNLK